MSGVPEHNFPAFNEQAKRLRALGYKVVNPAELNPEGTSWADCMRKDIAQLVTCDTIAKLDGWQNSKGATVEVELARKLGMFEIFAVNIDKPLPVAHGFGGDLVFLQDVMKELTRARAKFPGNTLQMMALSEEVGELAQALIDHRMGKQTARDVYAEAVQVAAMAVRVAVDGDNSTAYLGVESVGADLAAAA